MATSSSAQIDTPGPRLNQGGHHHKILVFVILCLAIAVVGHLLLSSHAANRRRHTCSICRLNRVDYTSTITGRVRSTSSESSCSKWYSANVESDHDHIWVRSSSIGLVNFYGQTIGVGDNNETPGRCTQSRFRHSFLILHRLVRRTQPTALRDIRNGVVEVLRGSLNSVAEVRRDIALRFRVVHLSLPPCWLVLCHAACRCRNLDHPDNRRRQPCRCGFRTA